MVHVVHFIVKDIPQLKKCFHTSGQSSAPPLAKLSVSGKILFKAARDQRRGGGGALLCHHARHHFTGHGRDEGRPPAASLLWLDEGDVAARGELPDDLVEPVLETVQKEEQQKQKTPIRTKN